METKLSKIKLEPTATAAKDQKATELHIPKKCDNLLQNAIIRFLDTIDDHAAIKKCCKTWGITYKAWSVG